MSAVPLRNDSLEDLISMAAKVFPGKAFSVVRQCILIDLTVTPDEKEKLIRLGLQPVTLYAYEVVLDRRCRFGRKYGCAAISGFYPLRVACLTPKNPVYLLKGNGSRKQASLKTAFSLTAN